MLLTFLVSMVVSAAAADPPADKTPRWWKGNTHTHTYWSDGNAAPEHVADWYVRNGYHFLVLSDHNTLSEGEKWFPISSDGNRPLTMSDVDDLERRFGPDWVRLREQDGRQQMRLKTLEELETRFQMDGKFIFIQGEEITDHFRRTQIHINGLNLAERIPPQGGSSVQETIQRNLDAVVEHGRRHERPVLGHVNHPNFQHSLTPEDVAAIKGERFFEVYNGHRGVLTNGDERSVSMEVLWDRALTLRLTELDLGLLYGLATDDAHEHHGRRYGSTPGRGWVYVHATTLTPDAIITAMRAGDFYASTGVVVDDITTENSELAFSIRTEEGLTYTTEFIGTRLQEGTPGPPGEVLATVTSSRPVYRMRGDELYVRARVRSSRLHPNPFATGDRETAWIQPVPGPALP